MISADTPHEWQLNKGGTRVIVCVHPRKKGWETVATNKRAAWSWETLKPFTTVEAI
jgi:hypothetical protein